MEYNILVLAIAVVILINSVHVIQEGRYYKNGALIDKTSKQSGGSLIRSILIDQIAL